MAEEPSPIAPTPVVIADTPIPVTVVDTTSTVTPVGPAVPIMLPPVMVKKDEGVVLAPNTTEEGDRVTKAQRETSLLWERTQATIAVSVVAVTLFVLAVLALRESEISSNAVLIVAQLLVLATFIVTSYFQRTNHTRIGGIGPKADEVYRGR